MAKKRQSADPDTLLDIKEAAGLLNVSTASLRRWTDAGRMPCYRIGAQRARRFRREDLVAFIGGMPLKPPATGGTRGEQKAGTRSAVSSRISGMNIEYGHHVCAIYGRPAGRIKLSVPILSEGLARGDKCFLVAGREANAHILGALADAFEGLQTAIDTAQLAFPEFKKNKEDMLESLEEQFIAASATNECRLRIVGDMQWALAYGWGLQELYEYELVYNNTLGHRFPVISLCQYDAEIFSGKGVLDALKSHEDTYHYPIGQFCI